MIPEIAHGWQSRPTDIFLILHPWAGLAIRVYKSLSAEAVELGALLAEVRGDTPLKIQRLHER